MSCKKNIIGIVGGMGPQAGTALLDSITVQTNAQKDQQHLSTILMSFPQCIVDRTAFLEQEEKVNPAYNIASIITKLEQAGATIVGIACNTSHVPRIYDVIVEELRQRNSAVRLLHMPSEICQHVKRRFGHARRVGLMATNGTYRSGVYEERLKRLGYEVIVPEDQFQNDVIHRMIYDKEFGIKAHANGVTPPAKRLLGKALAFFRSRQTDVLILGCTELSLILTKSKVDGMAVVDSTATFARALIGAALPCRRLVGDNHNPSLRSLGCQKECKKDALGHQKKNNAARRSTTEHVQPSQLPVI